jgi:hypothetical protein
VFVACVSFWAFGAVDAPRLHSGRICPHNWVLERRSPARRIERETSMARYLMVALLAGMGLLLSGCEAIGTIFEAGIWVGVIGVVVILAVIGLVVAAVRR